jgi:hypothetical protein
MKQSAVCWGLWKLRNELCFQDVAWKYLEQVWWKVLPMLRCWTILVPVGISGYGFESATARWSRWLRGLRDSRRPGEVMMDMMPQGLMALVCHLNHREFVLCVGSV